MVYEPTVQSVPVCFVSVYEVDELGNEWLYFLWLFAIATLTQSDTSAGKCRTAERKQNIKDQPPSYSFFSTSLK